MKQDKDKVIYIKNTKEFIVNGSVMKESQLDKKRINELKKNSDIQELLISNNQNKGQILYG